MATIYTSHQDWHSGELAMHRLMSAPTDENPTSLLLTPSAAHKVQASPILAIGTIDDQGKPWTSIWGGEKGFARPMRVQEPEGGSAGAFGARCLVDNKFDPVLRALRSGHENTKKNAAVGKGRKVSGLAIDLADRKRAKWAGEVLGVVMESTDEARGSGKGFVDLQIVVKVNSSLGNCPKYLNKKMVRAVVPSPTLFPDTKSLPPEALELIYSTDCFFLTTSHQSTHLSTNYRGGPQGFLRVLPSQTLGNSVRLAYPEYSGNRLYQTLGNIQTTPFAGLAIPNFLTGDVLYATASAAILAGPEAAALIPRSNLAVLFTLDSWCFVKRGLSFIATPYPETDNGMSPYNPPVRRLASEIASDNADPALALSTTPITSATLVSKTQLSHDVARFSFSTDKPMSWTAGQHAALSFANEMDTGYSHMRDDDPRSLNEDWVRTFTISSPPPPGKDSASSTFEILIRNVGVCTAFLFAANPKAGTELGVLGFGGEFSILENSGSELGSEIGFVAGGVGITPLLAQLPDLIARGTRVQLTWSIRGSDIQVGKLLLKEWSQTGWLMKGLTVHMFIGARDQSQELGVLELERLGAVVKRRRIGEEDLVQLNERTQDGSSGDGKLKWYICAGKALADSVEAWLSKRGCETARESFAF